MGQYFLVAFIINFTLTQIFCDPSSAHHFFEKLSRKKRQDEGQPHMENMTLEEFKSTCGRTYDIDETEHGPVTISSPVLNNGKYANNIECEWYIVGNRECMPQIQCEYFDMRKINKKCNDEFLQISDGLGGQVTLCEQSNLLKDASTTSFDAYELYIKLKIAKDPKFTKSYKGFKCVTKCAPNIKKIAAKPTHLKVDPKCVCGIRRTGRIVAGSNVDLNEFPWQAAMVDKGTRHIRCGASIINNYYALTASHCIFNKDKSRLLETEIDILLHAQLLDKVLLANWKDVPLGKKGSIRTPGWNMSKKTDADERTVRLIVAEIITHPLYNDRFLDYDIALLRLTKPVNFKNDKVAINPICMPPQGLDEKKIVGKMMTVVGWGLAHENAGAATRLLQKNYLPFQAFSYCEKINNRNLSDRMECAGFKDGRKDSCTGDSGGALFDDQQGKRTQAVQIGIVSHGHGCARKNQFGVYTRVSELIQWVHYMAKGATWCQGLLSDYP